MRSVRSLRSFPVRTLIVGTVSILWLACGDDDLTAPEPGRLAISTTTTGSPEDPDGYVFQVDDDGPLTIGANASVTVTDLPPGDHQVRLSEVADNCAVTGENPRTVPVPAGDQASLTFEIACAATVGGLTITTATGGPGLDPDGYTVQVDDGAAQPIGPSASLTLADLPPGPHTVTLGGLAPNCQVEGDNPRTVTVVAGERAQVDFGVTCTSGIRGWTPMTSGTRADLPDVWGTSGTDMFAVGELPLNDDLDVASVILHWDGTAWTRQLRESNLSLRGVWGSSSSDVYAVGLGFFTPEARIFHYDGTRWDEVPGFVSDSEELSFASVWGSSATDVFAVGAAFDGTFDGSLIYHYDGTTWERMSTPTGISPVLEDVWGSSATDVYAVGVDNFEQPSVGVILRYDGGAWLPVLAEDNLFLRSVWGSSATDIFAAGFRVEESGDDSRVIGTVLHYDGTGWSPMSVPRTEILNEVAGTSAADVFVVGNLGTVLHYDGTEWTRMRPTNRELLGVWAASPSDVFAVGERGAILRGTP
jgi:hypothetical protein